MMRDLFREGRDVDAALVRSAENDAQGRADVELLRPPSRSAGTLVIKGLLRLWHAV
jgi:hypothetical protein